jgi:hypothetical protein
VFLGEALVEKTADVPGPANVLSNADAAWHEATKTR